MKIKKIFAVCIAGTLICGLINCQSAMAQEDNERYEVQYVNDFEHYNTDADTSKQYKYSWLTAYGIINGDVYNGNLSINRFTTKCDPDDDPSVQGDPSNSKNWVFPDYYISDPDNADYGFYGAVEDNDKKSGTFWMGGKYNLNVMKSGGNKYLQMGNFYMLGKEGQQDYTAAYLVRNGIDMSESVVWESKICFDNASDEPAAKEAEVVKLEIAEAGSLIYSDSNKSSTIPVNLNAGSYAVLTFNNGNVYLGERNGHTTSKYNSDFVDEGFCITDDSNKLESGKWYTVRYTLDNSTQTKRHSVVIKDESGNEVVNSGMRELKLDTSKAIQGTYLDKDWNARVNRSYFSFDPQKEDKGFVLTVMNMADNKLGAHKNPRNKFLLDDYCVYKQEGLKIKNMDDSVKFIENSTFDTEFNYELDTTADNISDWVYLTDESGRKVDGEAKISDENSKVITYTLKEKLEPNTYYDVHYSGEIEEKEGLFAAEQTQKIKTTDASVLSGNVTFSSADAVTGSAVVSMDNLNPEPVTGRVIAFVKDNGVIYNSKVYSFKINDLALGGIQKEISEIDLPKDKENAEFVAVFWNSDGSKALTEWYVKELN